MEVGCSGRKMKEGSIKWRCDRCVVRVECLGKIDIETVRSSAEAPLASSTPLCPELTFSILLRRFQNFRRLEQSVRCRDRTGVVGAGGRWSHDYCFTKQLPQAESKLE
ncbi:hypothetical protein EVAR_61249_1 [Eumeta japonica]|uniref:Uncharacterized protein n=1 Tax=Eumeta variegata TaxID=151549 RepID=A0A4C1Z6P7_EUMVA|nr:hypothetical protein EVAR_61249_1 [Eumeta japonica]